MFKTGFQVNPDIPLLHAKVEKDCIHDLMIESSEKGIYNNEKTDGFKQSLLVKYKIFFEKMENAGRKISLRSSKCLSCKLYKKNDQSEILRVREEV